MTNYKFDIIIPTFNSENTIKKCLNSISNQTISKELINVTIVDNLSKDKTLKIAQLFNKKLNLTIISEMDTGIYNAMNKGILATSNSILYFLGSDDSLYSNTVLENIYKEFSNEILIIWGDCYLKEKAKIKKQNYNKEQIFLNYINHQSVFYNRKIFENNLFQEKFNIYADQVLTRKLIFENFKSTKYLKQVITCYSMNGTSNSTPDYYFLKRNYKEVFKYAGFNKKSLTHCNSTAINIVISLNKKRKFLLGFKGYLQMIYFSKKVLFLRTYIKSLFIGSYY